jgi:hypothetical protein
MIVRIGKGRAAIKKIPSPACGRGGDVLVAKSGATA